MKLKTQQFKDNRRADIGTVLGRHNVVCYENGNQVKIIECHDHNEHWAMDVAQAWCEKKI